MYFSVIKTIPHKACTDYASGNYAPNFAHYTIPNFPKKSLIMLIAILFMLCNARHCYYYSIVATNS